MHQSVCSDPESLFLGAQYPAVNLIKEHGPKHGCWDPPATLVHLQISLNEKARETSHASSRNIPNPQILVHQADNWEGLRQREAGDRREWICISTVSILGLFSFPRGNV